MSLCLYSSLIQNVKMYLELEGKLGPKPRPQPQAQPQQTQLQQTQLQPTQPQPSISAQPPKYQPYD